MKVTIEELFTNDEFADIIDENCDLINVFKIS